METYMKINPTRITQVIALLLTFLLTQVFLGLTFAAPSAADKRIEVPAPQATAVLSTQGNKPITLNGTSAASGATILSGATIETPAGVSATVSIPGHGTLMISVNTKLMLEFDPTGNIRVMLVQGCVVLDTKKGTLGEVNNAGGSLGKSDGSKDATIDTCQTRTSPAAVGGGGLSTGAKVAIAAAVIGGGAAAILAAGGSSRGANPSPSAP
jgi:hypothetical protein